MDNTFLYLALSCLIKMDLADRDEDADCGLGNGCLQSSDSGKTALTPEGYYDSRLGDLAPFVPVSKSSGWFG